MDRAIRTAKASRNAPYPAKVAIPSLERLTLGAAALDKELDRRAQPRRRFPASLGTEREAKVREAMRKEGVISTMPGAEVTARDIRKLGPGQWLNDEVINFYAVLLNVCVGLLLTLLKET